MTQNDHLIHHMRSAFITPIDALHLCGCMNFSGRISEILKRYDLKYIWVVTNKNKRVKAFKIKGIK